MDQTDFSTSTELQESPVKTREVADRYVRLRDVASDMLKVREDPRRLEQTVLDCLLRELRCERGTVLYDEQGTGGALRTGSSRRVTGQGPGEQLEISDEGDPEFSLNHRIVKKAVSSGEPVVIKGCLGEPASEGIEVSHSVLCFPFSATPERLGVFYLARAVGESPFEENELAVVQDFALICLPILQRALLEKEIRRVRSEGADAASEEASAEEEESADGEPAPGGEVPTFHGIVGNSEKLRKIFELVEKIKDTDFNVCIVGESGTGKELLARAIHEAGKRRDARFISENCGAISETLLESELFGYVRGAFTGADDNRKGLFELADGGTLFLDEIGDMSEGMQRKLLRALQEGVIRPIGSKKIVRVDVRVLCASNRDLRHLVEQGTFRADLYYRLNVISIEVPPLRERMEDIPHLVRHIMDEIARDEGVRRRLSESAMKALLSYSWPGNVRELTNVLRRLVVIGKRRVVTRKEILPLLSGGPARSYVGEGAEEIENQIVLRIPRRTTFNEIIAECEKAVLMNALRENRWNKSRVTKVLQIPRQSLYNKIARYGLKRSAVRD